MQIFRTTVWVMIRTRPPDGREGLLPSPKSPAFGHRCRLHPACCENGPKPGKIRRKPGFDLLGPHSLPVPQPHLPKIRMLPDFDIPTVAKDFRCLEGSSRRAGIDRVEGNPPQPLCQILRLSDALFRQGRIAPALESVLHIPLGLTVPRQI